MKTIEDYNTLVKTYIDTKDSAKAPTDHSSTATTYGVGSTTKYGHVKVDDALSSTSTNPVQNKKVYELKQALTTLTNYTIKNGVQNLLPNELKSVVAGGITVVVDSDGVISLSGTADYLIDLTISANVNLGAGTYKLSGTPSGGGTNVAFLMPRVDGSYSETNADMGNGKTITASNGITAVVLRIRSGANVNGLVFKPMIVDTKVSTAGYSDFVPYAKTNVELTQETKDLIDNAFANGAVNALENTAAATAVNGVTFIVNADKTVTVSTGAGGATANANLAINQTISVSNIPKGTWVLSSGISDANCYLSAMAYNGTTWVKNFGDTSQGDLTMNVDYSGYDTIRVYLVVVSGSIYTTSKTVKPMIAKAGFTDYVIHAKSNKELTDVIASKAGTLSATSLVSTNALEFRQFGKVVAVNGYLILDGNQTADGVTTNDLGTVSGVDLPNINRAVRTLCGIAANPWEKPTEVTYITLTSTGNLQLKLSTSGAQSVYFSFSYVVA